MNTTKRKTKKNNLAKTRVFQPFRPPPHIPMVKTLNVQLMGQQTDMWCWAASGEMIMNYAGHDVAQCKQANHRFGRTDCCNTPTPTPCVTGGWPEFSVWNFSSQTTSWGVALTFAQLVAQINGNMPVGFSWGWTGGGGHMMVACGYSNNIVSQMVYVNNPWPPTTGATQWITYADYVAQANDHVHWQDYFNIVYSGSGAGSAGSASGNGSGESGNEGSPLMASSGYADPETAARESLKLLPLLVTPDTAQELGFDAVPGEASALSLGQPFAVFLVRLDALRGHLSGQDVRRLLVDGDEFLYPVRNDSRIASSVAVTKREGVWSFKSLGNSALVKDLAEVRDRLTSGSGKSASNYFIVHIPSLYLMFIGHYDTNGKLMLTHIHDHPEYGFLKHHTQPGEEVILRILPRAKANQQALPERS